MAAINLEKMKLVDLIELDGRLKAAIAVARDKQRADIKKKMTDLAETHGFSVAEIFGNPHRGTKRAIGLAKYVNPADASDTWTGRGRKPNWLVARLKKGGELSDFEI
jgi:DNA-binding protein H-NS